MTLLIVQIDTCNTTTPLGWEPRDYCTVDNMPLFPDRIHKHAINMLHSIYPASQTAVSIPYHISTHLEEPRAPCPRCPAAAAAGRSINVHLSPIVILLCQKPRNLPLKSYDTLPFSATDHPVPSGRRISPPVPLGFPSPLTQDEIWY
jgi:hypothetical protein